MSRVIVHHDKETYSEIDLTEVGAYKYARDASTDCLLTSGRVDGERELRRWRPGDPYPYADIDPADIEIHAWNSQFERLIWRHVMVPVYGWPELELEQFVCVSAQARAMASGPAKLDTAGKFFNTGHRKDNKGHLHMLKMCRPATEREQLDYLRKHPGDFEGAKRCHHTKANMDRLHAYCDPDVLTEEELAHLLPPWTQDLLEAFWRNERINDNGIVIDLEFAQAAAGYAGQEKAYFARRIIEITGGAVETPRQFQRIQKWAWPLMSDEARKVCEWYDNGEKKISFDADTRSNLLSEAAQDITWIAHDPYFTSTVGGEEYTDAELLTEFIELLDAAGKSTVSKYTTLANMALQDDEGNFRVHGVYMFAGASQSGRYSSIKLQAHNLVREVPDNTDALISAFKRNVEKDVQAEVKLWSEAKGRNGVAEPIHALGQLVRPTLIGCPDNRFDLVWGDWSSIEACGLPWLSLDPRADDRLALLRRGEDIYLKTASKLTGHTVTKEDKFERQAYGKVPELSLGYLGGVGAFLAMAKNYGVRLLESQIKKIVKDWREDNPWAMDFGEACVNAAMSAIRRPGAGFSAGRLNYVYDPDELDGIGALLCILPSKRVISYPGARIQIVSNPWGESWGITAMKSAWQPKKGEPWEHWPRVTLWKGLLIENPTQAICAELLNLGLKRAEKAGLIVCAHTHDEIVIESEQPERDAKRLHDIMTQRPPWQGADAFPIRAEVEFGYRYKVPFKHVEEVRKAA